MKLSHAPFEKYSLVLLLGILFVVAIGGLVEIAPLFYLKSTIEKVEGMRPYSPLELAGRDIYIREGCYLCHSQMIRTLKDEVERYGHYSLAAESMYDHPFQWGSKRTGPDLARVGGKYSDDWHAAHLTQPALGRAGKHHAGLSVPRARAAGLWRYRRAHGDLARSSAFPTPTRDRERESRSRRAEQRPTATAPLPSCNAIPRRKSRKFDGKPGDPTELDAVIAYLQMLGTLVDFAKYDASGPNLR